MCVCVTMLSVHKWIKADLGAACIGQKRSEEEEEEEEIKKNMIDSERARCWTGNES